MLVFHCLFIVLFKLYEYSPFQNHVISSIVSLYFAISYSMKTKQYSTFLVSSCYVVRDVKGHPFPNHSSIITIEFYRFKSGCCCYSLPLHCHFTNAVGQPVSLLMYLLHIFSSVILTHFCLIYLLYLMYTFLVSLLTFECYSFEVF